MSFLNSIKDQSKKHEFPFDHWEYNRSEERRRERV